MNNISGNWIDIDGVFFGGVVVLVDEVDSVFFDFGDL